MRFIVDTMLGTLAKWLRVLGYDSLYDTELGDDEMLDIAVREGRAIISRDRELCRRKDDSLLIESTVLEEQLAAVVERWPPDESRILSRCLECNSLLESVPKDVAMPHVPEGVGMRHSTFWRCNSCNRFYWPGTHWQGMVDRAKRFTACRNSPR